MRLLSRSGEQGAEIAELSRAHDPAQLSLSGSPNYLGGYTMRPASKRQFQRKERAFSVQVASQGQVYQTTSRNLSMGGMSIVDCPSLPLNTPVKLFAAIQDHLYDSCTMLLLNAIPVWQDDETVGLRFFDVPRDVRESLAAVTTPGDLFTAAL
jgi:hypothetical protein